MQEDPKEKTRNAFAARFRLALDELGLSPREQTRLQRTFGVSGQAVRKWLDGTAIPTPARIPEIAEQLGVRAAWLQYGEGPMRPQGIGETQGRWEVQPAPLSADEARLIARYRALTDDQRRALDIVLRSMITGAARSD